MTRKTGFTEAVTVDEGYAGAVRTLLHFDADGSGSVTIQHQQDMEPVLQHCEQTREAMASGWGEGRLVGHIPALVYPIFRKIRDPKERERWLRAFWQRNPQFLYKREYLRT